MENIHKPKVNIGIGVIILNHEGQILLGKRNQTHGSGEYALPGGKPDLGETFEETAIREIREETNLTIESPELFAVSNNPENIKKYGDHWVVVYLKAKKFKGKLQNCEPKKCEGWNWYDLNHLPAPVFVPSKKGIECYKKRRFYIGEK